MLKKSIVVYDELMHSPLELVESKNDWRNIFMTNILEIMNRVKFYMYYKCYLLRSKIDVIQIFSMENQSYLD